MAAPTVFVSSTFYDLRHVRESMKRFIESLGYVAVLSEDGAVFYDPQKTAAESCLAEIPNTQMFVLVIGGRYGMLMPERGDLSVTNQEYEAAVANSIPTFALVEQGTYSDYQLYKANVSQPEILSCISFPNADSVKIFEFIDRIQSRPLNNALVPFADYRELEVYLRAQWAGLMHSHLTRAAEQRQVMDALSMMNQVNSRIEALASQILRSVGTDTDRLVVRLLERMLSSTAVSDLRYIGHNPTPRDILLSSTLEKCAERMGKKYEVISDKASSTVISGSGEISRHRLDSSSEDYLKLRKFMVDSINEAGLNQADFKNYPYGWEQPLPRRLDMQ
jgi:Domain of unknown function (DUF4062)